MKKDIHVLTEQFFKKIQEETIIPTVKSECRCMAIPFESFKNLIFKLKYLKKFFKREQ